MIKVAEEMSGLRQKNRTLEEEAKQLTRQIKEVQKSLEAAQAANEELTKSIAEHAKNYEKENDTLQVIICEIVSKSL